MFNPKVSSVFRNLEKQSRNISAELHSFMGTISEWADELVENVEKEYTAGKESTFFLLSKTPSEPKTRNRKAKNAFVDKCSVINSTFLANETNNLDETVSSRTRGARKAATFKMSQFNNTRDLNLAETKQYTLVLGENTNAEIAEATFVMPKGSARTKPVLRSKQPEVTVPEPETAEVRKSEVNELHTSNGSSERESPPKKVSRSRITSDRASMCKVSGTPSWSAEEESKKTPIVVTETPVVGSSRRKISRTLSASPAERPSSRKICRNFSRSPAVRSSSLIVPRSPSKSPIVRSSSLRSERNVGRSPATRSTTSKSMNSTNTVSPSQKPKGTTPEFRNTQGNRTVTIKKESTPLAASTFIVLDEPFCDEERTPIVKEERIFRFSKTSTPAIGIETTLVLNAENNRTEENGEDNVDDVAESSVNADTLTEELTQDAEVPKKKRKLKKDEEVKENIEEIADTMRITRTKSKAIKQMMEENETKQADLSAFAKKLLNKAKMTTVKKNQLATLLESNISTPSNGSGLGSNLPFGNLTTSKSKYHLLLTNSKQMKTPLATLPNSTMKMAKTTADKNHSKPKVASRDSSVENAVRSVTKPVNPNLLEKEIKLKSKKEKEKEAALKRQNVIKSKQEELKRKNDLKHQMAMKQREKLEQEKYHSMIQSEKEKEERHKLLLQERQLKLKEEALKKKMLTQQKIAETVERRRLEEEARIAKLKEMEAEEQRLALEKQKENERQEKRAQERLAQKKAREEYEMQVKQELEEERLRAEKLLTAKKCQASASKLQSANKRQKFGLPGEKQEWDYKPRNENDYGLEDEHSEVDSEDEKSYDNAKPAIHWAKKILHRKCHVVKILTLDMLYEFMPCYQKSPDIHRMFKMTPSKRIKRSSSAIWHTPSS